MSRENEKDGLTFLLGKAHYVCKGYMDSYLKEHGSSLTPPEAYLMNFIYERNPEKVSFPDLLKDAKVSKGTLSECLSGLSKKGLVETIIIREDRRKRLFCLTEEGIRQIKRQKELMIEAEEAMCHGVSEDEAHAVLKTLTKIVRNCKGSDAIL